MNNHLADTLDAVTARCLAAEARVAELEAEVKAMRPVIVAVQMHYGYNRLLGPTHCLCPICTSWVEYESRKPK
jgi:hypothetical protein